MPLLRPPLCAQSRRRLSSLTALKKGDHLYLIDGSGYLFRAYHALPPLTRKSDGLPTGAVSGYCNMVWKLLQDMKGGERPTHLAVVFDAGEVTFRNKLYDKYKANRPPPPEDLVPQFPLIRDATRAFSLPLIEEENVEADDMIASYARAATMRGWDVTIVSSDKDLMQLVGKCAEPHDGPDGQKLEGGCIDMLDTMKNQRIDVPEVVDNVPGIRGIGPKTATKLIQEYGSLEGALEAAPGMKPSKMQESLIEQA